jgi:uncharacterized membrane protein YadS
MVVPLFTDDPIIQKEIIGAWIGGTIDTTSGVGASSEMAGDIAQRTAIVVKATQNVLIGFVAFFIALYLSARNESGKMQRPSLGIVWEKFPKFVLGFVVASAVFSVLAANDMLKKGELKEPKAAVEQVAEEQVVVEKVAEAPVLADPATKAIPTEATLVAEGEQMADATVLDAKIVTKDDMKAEEAAKAEAEKEKKPERKKNSSKDIAKMFSGLFFSLAFVCIGLDTRLKDIISKENRALLKSFLVAQTFNIIVTFVIACIFFGVLKQM